jgi:hypothetical protein
MRCPPVCFEKAERIVLVLVVVVEFRYPILSTIPGARRSSHARTRTPTRTRESPSDSVKRRWDEFEDEDECGTNPLTRSIAARIHPTIPNPPTAARILSMIVLMFLPPRSARSILQEKRYLTPRSIRSVQHQPARSAGSTPTFSTPLGHHVSDALAPQHHQSFPFSPPATVRPPAAATARAAPFPTEEAARRERS